jgi:hypothetical protein
MRPSDFVPLLFAVVACTDPKAPTADIRPVSVYWLEWPAEVTAATSFTTRLVFYSLPCGVIAELEIPTSADSSAVTLAPYYAVEREVNVLCLAATPVVEFDGPTLIAADVPVAGLSSDTVRTYEMRATTRIAVPSAAPAETLDVRTFGEVIVRNDTALARRSNAAGLASFFLDTLDCFRVSPYMVYSRPDGKRYVSRGSYVVDSVWTDSAIVARQFVRGYLYDAAVPVCGQTRVFHLVTRN